uniref:Uncharacterized protein n=1 Tax=Setaria italica TaxID=4555 RepID=K3YKZ5_SETIT
MMKKDLGIGSEVGFSKNAETVKRSPVLPAMNHKSGIIHGYRRQPGSLAVDSWYLPSKLDL